MVLAVCGEEHDLIVKLTQKYFQFPVSNYPPHQRLLSKYIGGEQKIEAENIEQTKAGIKEKPFSHLMLGFESCGVENEDIYSVFTLQSLLGGGGSFSSGGPGKGMHSRLYRNVLNGHSFVEAVNCFNHSYWGVVFRNFWNLCCS
jgi:processing peptidase subunit alpha